MHSNAHTCLPRRGYRGGVPMIVRYGGDVMTAIPSWDVVSDAELAGAAAAGDRAAFAGIYDRYADRLHDFCIGMVRDRDAAADCVQDVFCTAATTLAQGQVPGVHQHVLRQAWHQFPGIQLRRRILPNCWYLYYLLKQTFSAERLVQSVESQLPAALRVVTGTLRL
jgi:hypothetical protein